MTKASTTMPLPQLAQQIVGHNTAAERQIQKAEDHYKSIGLHLIEARKRIKGGETSEFKYFSAFCSGGCGIAKSRAYELIAIAEGRTTLEEIREYEARKKRGQRQEDPGEAQEAEWAERQRQKQASGTSRTTSNSRAQQGNPESERSKDGTRRGGHNKKSATPEQALLTEIAKLLKGADREVLQDVLSYTRERCGRPAQQKAA